MCKPYLAGAALAMLAVSGAAQAADLPSRRAPQDYYAAPPVFSWTGFYVGLNAGYGWGSFTDGSDQLLGKPSGFVGGLTAGFNWQAMPNFVLGVEGDWNLSGVSDHAQLPFFGFNGQGHVTSVGTLRGRAGFAADRALVYVTGGLALASISASINDWRAIPFYSSYSGLQTGWALGGGLEYAFTDHISAKAEYMFTSVGTADAFTWTPDWARIGNNLSQIRAGVNYRF
jgi:outer membrane immunogenic protein